MTESTSYPQQKKPQSHPERLAIWLFSQTKNWRNVLAFLLIVALTYISIRFNIELGRLSSVDDTSKQLLPTGYALLDLAALFLSGYVGLRSRSIIRKLIAWVWFCFLLCLSLWAAASFTLSVDTRLEHQEVFNAVKAKKFELKEQAETVKIWQKNLSETSLFKTRYTKLLNTEQNKYRTIQAELKELESQLPPAAMAINHKVAPLIGINPDTLATLVRLLWASALTLSPVVLTLLVAVEFGLISTESETPSPTNLNRNKRKRFTNLFHAIKKPLPELNRVRSKPEAVPMGELKGVHKSNHAQRNTASIRQGVQYDTGTAGKAGNRYTELKKSVLAGRTRPSVRGVREYCGCRQDIAKRYLKALAEQGVIERAGQGWKLRKLHIVQKSGPHP